MTLTRHTKKLLVLTFVVVPLMSFLLAAVTSIGYFLYKEVVLMESCFVECEAAPPVTFSIALVIQGLWVLYLWCKKFIS